MGRCEESVITSTRVKPALKQHLGVVWAFHSYTLKAKFVTKVTNTNLKLGGRGNWAVYYTSPQSLLITFFVAGFKTLGTFIEF